MLGLIPKLLGMAVGLVSVLWLALVGGWAVRHYDALTSIPSSQVRVLFLHWTLRPPRALWPEYVLGESDPNSPAARDLRTCRVNTAALTVAIARQNAAERAVAIAGAQALARSEVAVQRARSAMAAASATEARIIKALKPASAGDCERYRGVDAAFAETLR